MEFAVYPVPQMWMSVVELHNSVSSTHATLVHSDWFCVVDNGASYNINSPNLDIKRSKQTNLGRQTKRITSSIMATLYFDGPLSIDLTEC